jgi:hypothetical protein
MIFETSSRRKITVKGLLPQPVHPLLMTDSHKREEHGVERAIAGSHIQSSPFSRLLSPVFSVHGEQRADFLQNNQLQI